MIDTVSPKQRSKMMSGIKSHDTKPELIVRKALFKRGFRYRLHSTNLPGKLGVVLPKYKTVIFVHGCFWHMHDGKLFKWPKSNEAFWKEKLSRNKQRDEENKIWLTSDGWKVLTIWECSLKGKLEKDLEKLFYTVSNWITLDTGNQSTQPRKD